PGILSRAEPRLTDGDGVRVARRKARAVTVVLALQRNRTVSLDRIAEALWDTEPPASAFPNIRTYASAVRDALGPDKERLRTGDGGYRLRLAVDESDHATFLDLAERGHAALAGEQPRIAANLLERALRLWRGDEMAEG